MTAINYIIMVGFVCLVSTSLYSQDLSREEFNREMLSKLDEAYNIVSIPDGLQECAWQVYQSKGDVEEGFYTGYELAQKCLPNYLGQITYSDGGARMRRISLDYFEDYCVRDNKAYQEKVNVTQYCSCLRTQFNERDLSLATLMGPGFAQTQEYRDIAIQCFSENKY